MSVNNKVILIGRVASEFKLFKAKDKPAISFNIAINNFYKMDDNWVQNSQFVPIVGFGEKLSNHISSKYKKGNLIALEGKIFYSRDKSKSYFNVILEQINLLSKKEGKSKLNIPNSKEFEETVELEKQFDNLDFGLDKTIEINEDSDNPWDLDF